MPTLHAGSCNYNGHHLTTMQAVHLVLHCQLANWYVVGSMPEACTAIHIMPKPEALLSMTSYRNTGSSWLVNNHIHIHCHHYHSVVRAQACSDHMTQKPDESICFTQNLLSVATMKMPSCPAATLQLTQRCLEAAACTAPPPMMSMHR